MKYFQITRRSAAGKMRKNLLHSSIKVGKVCSAVTLVQPVSALPQHSMQRTWAEELATVGDAECVRSKEA